MTSEAAPKSESALKIESIEVPVMEMSKVNREMLQAYAEASGDPNEIHLNEEVAKKMGLPSVIAHGMLVAAWVSERAILFCRGERGLKSAWVKSISTRFQAMTFPGDSILVGGKATEVTPGEWKLDLQAKKPAGEVVISAVIVLSLT